MGKLINLLAGDFNSMETKLMFIFVAASFPFTVFGVAVVLVLRLGWIGLICIFTPILLMPINWGIGVKNGQIFTQLNVHKDARVKITGEVIEGIRFVKLYAWELAFNRIVGRLRSLEINKYIRIYLGQSFERAFSNSTTYWGVLLCFVALYFTGV